ncbi:DUF6882 domain-containing protein [Cellulosimicrobium sp. Marseille-Q4280]|uniref:DUF6882 domain-containing protein n=1 Tax=Cellulosimicrobium sp. Marseille-Q4280 TaxID=2937992 RepID=UPI00204259EF|nr:DUF6882 domain-containing protein [Cellulosimicrobium sp. Marseille-Q4280]
MTEPPVLQDLVDDAAFLSHEHELHLADLYGDDSWDADLSTGTFTFTSATGVATGCRLQFLGTSAPGPGTWMWAWHNVNDFPDEVLVAAEKTRGAGLPETTTAEFSLSEELPHRLTLAAKTTTGSFAHYSAPVGGGTRAWFLLEHPTLELPSPSVPRVVRTLSEGLLAVTVVDHRRAVLAYAHGRGLEVEPGDDGAVVLVVPGGAVTVAFDDSARITQIQATARPAAEPVDAGPADAGPADGDPAPVGVEAEPAPVEAQADPGAADTGSAAGAGQPSPPPRRRWFRRHG